MPIIDVSQSSYRALVIAAHERGLSIDRFIQQALVAKPETLSDTNVRDRKDGTIVEFTGLRSITDSERGFDSVWQKIKHHSGERFSTKRGQSLVYEIETDYVVARESGARIPRSQFNKALSQWPAKGPSNMRGIYGASVIWSILNDSRILSEAA